MSSFYLFVSYKHTLKNLLILDLVFLSSSRQLLLLLICLNVNIAAGLD